MFYLRLEANIEETCKMIVVNNNNIPNKKIIESLGIVQEVQSELEMLLETYLQKLEL